MARTSRLSKVGVDSHCCQVEHSTPSFLQMPPVNHLLCHDIGHCESGLMAAVVTRQQAAADSSWHCIGRAFLSRACVRLLALITLQTGSGLPSLARPLGPDSHGSVCPSAPQVVYLVLFLQSSLSFPVFLSLRPPPSPYPQPPLSTPRSSSIHLLLASIHLPISLHPSLSLSPSTSWHPFTRLLTFHFSILPSTSYLHSFSFGQSQAAEAE